MSYYDKQEGLLTQAGIMGNNDPRMPTLTEQTRYEIQALEERLQRKRELLELLVANPDIQRVLDLMRG